MGLPLSTVVCWELVLDSAKVKISDARISPPPPDPRTAARSTPCSRARRRAFGEILTDCVAGCVGAGVCCGDAAVKGTAGVFFLPDGAPLSAAGESSRGNQAQENFWPAGTS